MSESEAIRNGPASTRLKVLVYTTLFPNSIQLLRGNFILERMRHLLPFVKMSVIAPVPYFPRINLNRRWFEFTTVPHTEQLNGFNLDHPRYLVFPKVGMATHGLSMFAGSLPQVWRRLQTNNYDLIDAHYVYPDGLAAVMLGALFKKPVVVSARGSDINLFSKFRLIRPMVREVLKRADALIAVSQSLKDVMVQLGCSNEKVTVIGNGVDSVKFGPLPQDKMRKKLGLPSDRIILLSVGRLIELKGFHVLVETMARLRERRSDLLLVIVGEGEYRKLLETQIRKLALHDSVRLVGAQPHSELSCWYSAADVFCLASSREGWANVLLEAMACGLPVVATRVGAAPEIVTSENFGILTERKPEAFESALEEALRRRWDRDAILAHARSHGWDKVASRILDIYSNVLSKRKRSRWPAN